MSTTTTEAGVHDALAGGLRAAADLLQQHPDLPNPYITSVTDIGVELNWYLLHDDDLAAQREATQRIIRTLGGHWDKEADSQGMKFTRGERYRDPVVLTILVAREAVCLRKVVGYEDVVVPAVEAQPERIEHREVVAWDCGPVLAGAVSE